MYLMKLKVKRKSQVTKKYNILSYGDIDDSITSFTRAVSLLIEEGEAVLSDILQNIKSCTDITKNVGDSEIKMSIIKLDVIAEKGYLILEEASNDI